MKKIGKFSSLPFPPFTLSVMLFLFFHAVLNIDIYITFKELHIYTVEKFSEKGISREKL